MAALEEAPYAFSSTLAEWQHEGDTEQRWRARLSGVPLNALAFIDEKAAGMVSATAPDANGTIELLSMWIAPFARGRGAGDALIATVITWARNQGAATIALDVYEGNERAIALYRRHGFTTATPDGAPGSDGEISLILKTGGVTAPISKRLRMDILYKASVTSTGGRDGGLRSSDGILDLQLALPPGLGGPGGKTNPEQLFAAAYAACFHGAIKKVAGDRKVAIGDSKVTAEVGIGPKAGGLGLDVDLFVELPRTPPEIAEAVVTDAHKLCPYSNATRGNIDVRIKVKAADGAELALA